MSSTARHVLIAGYYGHGNAGDEAILAAMLSDLRSLGGDLTFTVAGGDPARLAADHGVQGIGSADIPTLVDAVRASDLVILGGGGLFQDYWEASSETFLTSAQGGLFEYLTVPVLAGLLGRPLVIYAVGVGPLGTDQGRRLTRIAFGLSRAATVRDPASLELLRELGLPGPGGQAIEVAADPAFDLDPATEGEVDRLLAGWGLAPGEPLLGVALRHWELGSARAGWEGEVARGLDLYLEDFDGRVLFLPFQAAGPGPNENDPAVHRRIREALAARERAVFVEQSLGPAELAGVLGRCRLVLAMRFHAALFALKAGVPAVALAYDPKVSSLMARAGLSGLALPAERWQAEALRDALSQAEDHRWREAVAGFGSAMGVLARRSAELALGVLAAPSPELPEPRAFLAELAVEKILASGRQRSELAELRSRLVLLGEDLESARRDLESTRRDLESARSDLNSARRDLDRSRRDHAETLRELERTSEDLEEVRRELESTRILKGEREE
ncbi:MAG TPA: polysaccharide pyruvyl transferase family protein, partial [Thermoanaerobaculia bacterium]|nr:polysaccharide pyruvyl transferase family protein [Thermoanaerobaculia bacterium]